MATGNIDIVVKLVDKASRGLSAIAQKAGGLAKTLGGALRAGALAGGVALVGLVGLGVKFVKMAAEEEAGIKRLAAAVDNAGGSWAKQGAAIEAVIRQRQKLGFSDDEQRESLILLTSLTGNAEEALKRQAVAMDFARGTGMDLFTASKLLAKVSDENVGALGRWGIRVKAGTSATEVMRLVQKKFAGQSQAFAESTAGKWQRFNIALDNIQETIGAALLPLASKLAEKLGGFLEDHEEQIGRTVKKWTAFGQNKAFPAILGFVRDVRPYAEKFFDLFLTGLKTLYPPAKAVFEFIINNKVALIAAITAIGAAILLALGPGAAAVIAIVALIALVGLVKKNWSELEAKTKAVFNSLPGPVKVALEFIYSFTKARIEGVIQVFNSAYSIIKNVVSLVDNLLHGRWGAAWADLKKIASASLDLLLGMVKTQFGNLPAIILGAVTKAANAALGLGLKLGLSIVDGIKAGVIGLATFLWNTFKAAWNAGAKAANSVLNAASGLINKVDVFHIVPDLPKNPIPTLAKGGIVTKTGLAEVHEGEQFSGVGRRGGDIIINITGTWDLSNPNHIEQLTSALTGQIRRNLAMGA